MPLDTLARAEFRSGFYPGRPAAWIDEPVTESEAVTADVAGHLSALADGKRDFAYPGHDSAVFRILERIVPKWNLARGADIGCATGCFPAMQIAAGVKECTVYEVRETRVDHPQVRVRIQDLTYDDGPHGEFDIVTCLSTIEHVGLGRYGDAIDPWGDIKMAESLRKLLRPGGVMLLSFPTGPGCVVFNKHRVYSPYRAALLCGGLETLDAVSDRSFVRRYRHKLGAFLGRQGAFMQPIRVLRRPL